ncbi:MAG TPA: protein DpdE [Mycobacterium sp.]|jgi:ATP-dependent helicase HepA
MVDVFVRHVVHGIGKRRDGQGVVRFFDGPARDEFVVTVGDLDVQPAKLEKHQRVWWHDGTRWLAGFVDGLDARGTSYLVDFPNGQSQYVEPDRLYTRWSQPIDDVVNLLKTGTVESRYLHERRSSFVSDVLRQQVASQGLAGIWSSGVEIHAHQVGAARRILADPVKRYLLADEVGLGKTVEAGMVIRQLLLDDTGAVLVLAPDGLIDQWRAELLSKFRVDQFGGRVQILPHSAIISTSACGRLLVVVDEAHRLTATSTDDDAVYRRLCELAHAATGALLLSATPVRSNEDSFLRMLHLLDPRTYPLDGLAQFRHRVAIRDALSQALAALGNDTPVMFLDEPSLTLRRLLPNEVWLQRELDSLDRAVEIRADEEARAVCQRIRTQLAETYRIHRRLIRARRSASLARLFPVRGRTVSRDWLVPDPDSRRYQILRLVEDLRVEIAGLEFADAPGIVRTVLGRGMAPVSALTDLALALRGGSGHDLDQSELASLTGFAGTVQAVSFAAQIEAILAEDTHDDRFTAMVEWAWPYMGSHRVAVTCSFPSTAAVAAERLEAHFGAHRVVRLLSSMDAADRAAAVRRFVDELSGAVIVLDRGGEEGINLQVVEDVLHLDLPVNIARLEQRLGRFDRWANRGQAATGPVRSTAFREETPDLDSHLGAWRRGLDEGLGLFEESSATLQYVLPAVEREFLSHVIDQGLPEAGARMASGREDLDVQRRRIEGQDLLDAIEDRTEDQQLAEGMRGADDAAAILHSFRGYAVEMLGFTENVERDGTRYGLSSKHPPRVTESEVLRLGPKHLRRHYAHQRARAVDGTGLLRWGEPLVDRFADLAMRDDRGRAFAIEINQPRREPGTVLYFFTFGVVIAPDSGPVDDLRIVDVAAASAAAIRLGQLFAPRFECIWWSPGQGEPAEQVRLVLDGADGDNLGSRPERFEYLTHAQGWPELCERATHEALRLIAQRPPVQQHLLAANCDAEAARAREEAMVQARSQVGADASSDARVFDTIAAAIDSPQLRIDSCGVVIVTGPEQ